MQRGMWEPKGQLSQPGGEERRRPEEGTLTEQTGAVRQKMWQSILAKGTNTHGGSEACGDLQASVYMCNQGCRPASCERERQCKIRQGQSWGVFGGRRSHLDFYSVGSEGPSKSSSREVVRSESRFRRMTSHGVMPEAQGSVGHVADPQKIGSSATFWPLPLVLGVSFPFPWHPGALLTFTPDFCSALSCLVCSRLPEPFQVSDSKDGSVCGGGTLDAVPRKLTGLAERS